MVKARRPFLVFIVSISMKHRPPTLTPTPDTPMAQMRKGKNTRVDWHLPGSRHWCNCEKCLIPISKVIQLRFKEYKLFVQ